MTEPAEGSAGSGGAAVAETAPKTAIRWADLPADLVANIREERTGERGYMPGGFGLMEDADEATVERLVAEGKLSGEFIETARHRRNLLNEAKVSREADEAASAAVPEDVSPAGESEPVAESAAPEPSVPEAAIPAVAPVAVAPEAAAAPEADPAALIAGANTWEELEVAVAGIPEIQGSQQKFTGEEMAGVVRLIAAGKLDSIYATRTYGIRDRLEGFILAENAARAAAEPTPDADAGEAPSAETPNPEPTVEVPPEQPAASPEVTPEAAPEVALDASQPAPAAQPEAVVPPVAPERPMTPERSLELARLEMEASRGDFIPLHQAYLKGRREKSLLTRAREALGMGATESASELPEALRLAKERYDLAKTAYGSQMYGVSRDQHLAAADPSLADREATAEAYGRARAFQNVFVNEFAVLRQAEAETWAPKERGVIRKSFDWWRRRGAVTRTLISTAALTGVAAATGGVALGAAGLFAGHRIVRSLIAAGYGHLAGKGFDRFVKDPGAADARAESRTAELRGLFSRGAMFWGTVEGTREMERSYRNIQEDRDREERRRLLGKAVVMGVVAGGAMEGMRWLDGAWPRVSAATIAEAPTAPAPQAVLAAAETPAVAEAADIVPPTYPAVPNFGEASVVAAPGADNVWAMVKGKLTAAGLLDGLPTRGAQNNLIDALYQKFAQMNPVQLRAIGIASGNLNRIADGATVNLSAAFGDPTQVMAAYERAGGLQLEQIASIEADAAALDSFRASHASTPLTESLANRLVGERRGR